MTGRSPEDEGWLSNGVRFFLFDLLTFPAMLWVRFVAWWLGITVDFYPEDEK